MQHEIIPLGTISLSGMFHFQEAQHLNLIQITHIIILAFITQKCERFQFNTGHKSIQILQQINNYITVWCIQILLTIE